VISIVSVSRRTMVAVPSGSSPSPAGDGDEPDGTATMVRLDTDTIEITAELPEPAILLITDAYDKGWRAVMAEKGPQADYSVMPANYILRAVPLAAGRHRFRLEYAPRSLAAGKCISLIGLIVYLSICIGCGWNHMRKGRTNGSGLRGTCSAKPTN